MYKKQIKFTQRDFDRHPPSHDRSPITHLVYVSWSLNSVNSHSRSALPFISPFEMACDAHAVTLAGLNLSPNREHWIALPH